MTKWNVGAMANDELFRICLQPDPPCSCCGKPAEGQFRLKDYDEVWCVHCVREALVRMTAERKP